MLPLLLPPALRSWCIASSAAAAASYADRGTSAIVASQLLENLHWTESQLGDVQGSFFAGYALTQVLGGLLGGGRGRGKRGGGKGRRRGGEVGTGSGGGGGGGGDYRAVLPLSLCLTAIATLLFPFTAERGGPMLASADRFLLGLFEGLLLPAAMAGVSDTATTTTEEEEVEGGESRDGDGSSNVVATASSVVVAGCYLGSAWAYLSAWALFSVQFQSTVSGWAAAGAGWGWGHHVGDYHPPPVTVVVCWPWVFYLNGIVSLACVFFFRNEFDFSSLRRDGPADAVRPYEDDGKGEGKGVGEGLWEDALSVASATVSSPSGRAIIAAQIGQGALLYSIASWGPLYLERAAGGVGARAVVPPTAVVPEGGPSASFFSPAAAAASAAASSLVLPQFAQALVGAGIGIAADGLSSSTSGIGKRAARRGLQIAAGTVPAALLWYLSLPGGCGSGDPVDDDALPFSPALLFGAAQAASALSLGAVSVSHLDVASPASAGAVYALGNVAAAASGSVAVSLFGRLLEENENDDGGGRGDEFAIPFRMIAILSAVGSLFYGCTVETELEIGFNETSSQ